MGATLLSLVQSAARELGLPVPPTVSGATDTQTQQLFGLANAVGAELLSMDEWTALQTQAVINVPAPLTATGNVVQGSNVIAGIPEDMIDVVPGLFIVTGPGIQVASRVTVVQVTNPGTDTLTIDMNATATAAASALTVVRDTFAVPADFVSLINRTQWDRTNHWELIGPMSPQENQWVMSGIVATGPRRRFRQVGRGQSVFRIWPPPTASDTPSTLAYEYLSSYWAQNAAATPQAQFVMDTDTCVFNDRVMISGIKWMYFQIKGFEYTKLESMWRVQVQTAMGRDGGAPTLSMARSRWPIFISPASVQDGDFPGRS